MTASKASSVIIHSSSFNPVSYTHLNESFIIFYFCIDFIESQCYNLQEIKKKKTLMRRVLCGKLPERDTFAESILSRQTKEDHLGVAVNQPG